LFCFCFVFCFFVDRCLSFCTFSCCHSIVCPFAIYDFQLFLSYLQTFLICNHIFFIVILKNTQILRPRIEHGNHYATKANPVIYGDCVMLCIGIVPLYIGIMVGIIYWWR
jgi:hypothetical protein